MSVSTCPAREELAPTPMGFLRASLFLAAERAKGHVEARQLETATNCGIEATYSGPILTQQHAVIWQALIREHRLTCGGDFDRALTIRQAELLRALGRQDTSTAACRWLWLKLKQLQGALIELRTTKHRYSGQLLGEASRVEVGPNKGAITIRLNRMLATLLSDEVALIDLDRKLSLGRHQVAAWLHDYLSTQSNTRAVPVPVADLHRLSGSPLRLPQFRQSLREAIDLLKQGDRPLLVAGTINDRDCFVYTKNPTPVVWIGEHIQRRHDTEHGIEARRATATKNRGMVAL